MPCLRLSVAAGTLAALLATAGTLQAQRPTTLAHPPACIHDSRNRRMTLRVLAVCWILLATGCSNGAEPVVAPSNYFTAQLTGSRTLQLTGSAYTSTGFIEPDTVYWVGMLETHGPAERREVLLSCGRHGLPGGRHARHQPHRGVPSDLFPNDRVSQHRA